MNNSIRPGRYRHFKGGEYLVIDLALHSETEQAHVVYRPLYGEGRLWVRPLSLFADLKEVDGQQVPRFERLEELPSETPGLQSQVADFCRNHQLGAPTSARLLDLCSELGELAKLWLTASHYGRGPESSPERERWQEELGDVLFSLLALAEESGVDAERALGLALERYLQRIKSAGHPGSGAD
ncbi:MAG: DUF1653 domain-containing protein [Wenzhouxiangella sp.]